MRVWTILLIVLMTTLAGCSGAGSGKDDIDDSQVPDVEVTDTTGGVRGVVVDQSIRPVAEATVKVTGADNSPTTAKTDDQGTFAISGLDAGTYFLQASHPLYDVQQTTVEVVAGVADPKPVKILLTRLIEAEPYSYTLKFEGYISCSINIILFLSEECGEGVGSPEQFCDLDPTLPCEDNPVFPGERIGKNANNAAQFDFYVDDAATIQTLVIEQYWEASSDAGRGFYTPVSTEWACDPICGGNRFLEMQGESPLYGRADRASFEALVLNETTKISTFTWTDPDYNNGASATLEQDYQIFVTQFYYLPAPEGWSFVNGDEPPF